MPPRSATRTSKQGSRRAHTAGFTLLELLVVLFVIAVMSGLAVIQLGSRDRDRQLETEVMRLQHLLELARNEAVLTASEWGLELEGGSYRFLRLDPESGRWEAIETRPWTEHELPSGIRTRLEVEERERALSALGNGEGRLRPGLLILSSGEFSPFRLELNPEWQGGAWHLSSDGFGDIEAERGAS